MAVSLQVHDMRMVASWQPYVWHSHGSPKALTYGQSYGSAPAFCGYSYPGSLLAVTYIYGNAMAVPGQYHGRIMNAHERR